jgi:hypothetical protein
VTGTAHINKFQSEVPFKDQLRSEPAAMCDADELPVVKEEIDIPNTDLVTLARANQAACWVLSFPSEVPGQSRENLKSH